MTTMASGHSRRTTKNTCTAKMFTMVKVGRWAFTKFSDRFGEMNCLTGMSKCVLLASRQGLDGVVLSRQ